MAFSGIPTRLNGTRILASWFNLIKTELLSFESDNNTVTGSDSTPQSITAGGGITPAGVSREKIYLESNSGAVDITANPQIAAGTNDGDELTLIFTSNTETLKINNGDGVEHADASNITSFQGLILKYIWNGDRSVWMLQSRND